MFFDYASFLSSLSKNDFSCLKVSCFWSPNLQPAYLMCVHSRRGKGKSRPIQGPVWAAPLSNLASLGQAKGRVSKLVERYLNSICRFGSTGIYKKIHKHFSMFMLIFFSSFSDAKTILMKKQPLWDPVKELKRGMKNTIQGQVYNFLERPTGWKCFLYHFSV